MALTLGPLGIASAQENNAPNTTTPNDSTIPTQSQRASETPTPGEASTQAVSSQARRSTLNGFTLTKKVSSKSITKGSNLTFTITEENNSGNALPFDVGINDVLPTSVEYVQRSAALTVVNRKGDTVAQGTCTNRLRENGGTVNCNNFFLPDGGTATMTLDVTAKKKGSFRNEANDAEFPGNTVTVPFKIT